MRRSKPTQSERRLAVIENQKDYQIWDEAEKLLVTIIANHTGEDEKEIKPLLKSLYNFQFSHNRMIYNISDIVTKAERANIPELLRRLKRHTDETKDSAQEAIENPILEKLLSCELSEDVVKSYLVDRGIEKNFKEPYAEEIVDKDNPEVAQLHHIFEDIEISLVYIQHYEDGTATAYANQFREDIAALIREIGDDFSKLFLRDYVDFLLEQARHISANRVDIDSLKAVYIAVFIKEDAELAQCIHELFMETAVYYKRARELNYSKSVAKILWALKEEQYRKTETNTLAEYISPEPNITSLVNLDNNDTQLNLVCELIQAGKLGTRTEMLDTIVNNSKIVQLYKAAKPHLKRYGQDTNTFNEFVLEYSSQKPVFSEDNCLDIMLKLAGSKNNAQIIPILLDQGINWTQDNGLGNFLDIVRDEVQPDLWVAEYFKLSNIKIEFLSNLIQSNFSYTQYKGFRSNLYAISDKELSDLLGEGLSTTVSSLENRDSPVTTVQVNREKIPWIDILLKSINQDQRKTITDLYGALEQHGFSYRLRYIWTHADLEIVSQFALDMQNISDSVRKTLLGSFELFKMYSTKLIAGEQTLQILKPALNVEESKIYSVLGTQLRGDKTVTFENEEEDDELDIVTIPETKRLFERIMIYGGKYRPQDYAIIEASASGKEVIITDYFRRKNTFPEVNDNDLVIIVREANKHTFTGRVKKSCARANVKPIYFHTGGPRMLAKLIDTLVS